MKYLGDRFDIHTGGTDLRFPHHEDEIAQSEGAVGHQVVSIWVHAGHLRQSGQKIAKSTGNVILVQDLRDRGFDPLSFRWLCFQTQYRSEMDFTWDAMAAADQRVRQLRHHMLRSTSVVITMIGASPLIVLSPVSRPTRSRPCAATRSPNFWFDNALSGVV